MPVYEYECEKCGRILEAYQKFSDPALRKCKECSGRLHKLISQSSFHLKGSGWYVTDYKNSKAADTVSSKTKPESKPTCEKAEKKTSKPSSCKKEA